jgi:hypothetical protein
MDLDDLADAMQKSFAAEAGREIQFGRLVHVIRSYACRASAMQALGKIRVQMRDLIATVTPQAGVDRNSVVGNRSGDRQGQSEQAQREGGE